MGIKNLMSLLKKKAPKCVKEVKATELKGHTIAFDASITMYQFLVTTTTLSKAGKINVLSSSSTYLCVYFKYS